MMKPGFTVSGTVSGDDLIKRTNRAKSGESHYQ